MTAGALALAQAPLAAAQPVAALANGRPFNAAQVRAMAAALAHDAYQAPAPQSGAATSLTYDDWREIRFRHDRSHWDENGQRVRLQYFPTGYLFTDPVRLYEVVDGQASPVAFDPQDFNAPDYLSAAIQTITGLSGFRLQSPINQPGVFDEIAVFQGASYFRSLGKDEAYGISARGISCRSGESDEEFPAFRAFWIEKPAPGAEQVVVHALLDGPSLAGAYSFVITPGPTTVFDVQASLYPRRMMDDGGLAPQSSMFLFGAADRRDVDDFRGAVHDSDGLEIWTGAGERIWRPLVNPHQIQLSIFTDFNPRGFGLSQRAKDLDSYNDLEAHYERRPSLWVEPVGDWGDGAVHLVELPQHDETGDNITMFWRPAKPWAPNKEVKVAYRLHWGPPPTPAVDLARVVDTRSGEATFGKKGDRQFVVDFSGLSVPFANVRTKLSASSGQVSAVSLSPFPDRALIRAAFRFTPPPSGVSELALRLIGDDGDLSESWRFQWT